MIGAKKRRSQNPSRIRQGAPSFGDLGEDLLLPPAEARLNLRCSWSPDGAHITASNATNNQGFVFIAAVITRNQWTSDISLVGHENAVEVAVCRHGTLTSLTSLMVFPGIQSTHIPSGSHGPRDSL